MKLKDADRSNKETNNKGTRSIIHRLARDRTFYNLINGNVRRI